MSKPRKPAVFSTDDPALQLSAPDSERETTAQAELPAPEPPRSRGWGWGALLASALGGLVVLALTSWAMQTVTALFGAGGWLGWLALGVALFAAFCALMLLVREAAGLMRLGRVTRLRAQAESVMAAAEDSAGSGKRRLTEVKATVAGLERLLGERPDTAWQLRRFREHRGDVMAPREMMVLAERELLQPLD